MPKEKTRRHNEALAGVIEALLLIALLTVVIGVIQTQYIPQIMEQREAEHMNHVSNQFAHLNSMIDIQALTGTMETEVPLRDIPMFVELTLGSRELPYLVSGYSYGELSLEDNGAYIDAVPAIPGKINGVCFSSIIYHAYNIYYPEQTYILEGGGIIIKQSTGTPVMSAEPSISVKPKGGDIEMIYFLPNFICAAGKDYDVGLNNTMIRTRYLDYKPCPLNHIPLGGFIFIYSQYPEAWNQSLNRRFQEVMYDTGDAPSPENKTIDIAIAYHEGKEVVKITPLKHPISLELKVVDIEVQIGKGWIYV